MTITKTDYNEEKYKTCVPIVFATNDKYGPFCGVTIQSLKEHVDSVIFYDIYVFHLEIGQELIFMLEQMREENISVRCVNVIEELKAHSETIRGNGHLSIDTYLRLLIPEILGFYEKVVYLDSDIVLEEDIFKLFSIDIQTLLLGVVRDQIGRLVVNHLERYFVPTANTYFNAGILLFNNKEWKQQKVLDACFEYIRKTPASILTFCDQDVLNKVCNQKVQYLEDRWNSFVPYKDPSYNQKLLSTTPQDRTQRVAIYHYIGGTKPWDKPKMHLGDYFWKYARKSPFYEEILFVNFLRNNDIEEYLQEEQKYLSENLDFSISAKRKNEIYQFVLKEEQQKIVDLQSEILKLKSSLWHKISKFITFIPKKCTSMLNILKLHGVKYTLAIIKEKLKR